MLGCVFLILHERTLAHECLQTEADSSVGPTWPAL